jgi:ribokinase
MNIDYVYRLDEFLRPGETKSTKSRNIYCGGKGLNQSIACARSGLSTYHVGLVGKEGSFLRDKLTESGVHTDYTQDTDATCGHAIIQVNDHGQNSILLFPGTNAMLTENLINEVLYRFSENDVVLLQNETNMVPYIMKESAHKAMRIAFNAAPYSGEVKDFPIQLVKWLFVNEIEGASLSNQSNPKKIVTKLRLMYPNTDVILTLGAEGCIYAGEDGYFEVPAANVVPVDTTAAGDTFTGYYLYGILNGLHALRSLQIASQACAIAITRLGASDSIPFQEEVKLATLHIN